MSISSCPRCTQQVTLPVGVSTSAQVRCPLCRAQYTLADALVNMPPLLEVVGDPGQEPSDDWFDMPLEARNSPATASAESTAPIHDATEPTEMPESSHPDAELGDGLLFEAAEVEHDDIVMQQQDTEIEELAFGDVPETDHPTSVAPLDLAAPADDGVLDFDVPVADKPDDDIPAFELSADAEPADEMAIDFGEGLPAVEPSDETDLGLEFEAEPAADGGEMEIDFGAPEVSAAADLSSTIDFGQSVEASDVEAEVGLDFGDPVAAVEPAKDAIPDTAPANDKKSRKKKEKKPREPKPPADGTRKRSPVVTGLVALLCCLFVIPAVLIGTLWISKDYDFFNVGPSLAAWGLAPSSFNKKQIARAPTLNFPPPANPAGPAETQPPEAQAPETQAPEPQDAPSGGATAVTPAPTDEATAPATEAKEKMPQRGATNEPAEPSAEPPAPEPVAATDEAKKLPSPAEAEDTSLDALLADDADQPKNMPVEAAKPVADAAKSDATATPDVPDADAPALGSTAPEKEAPAEAPSLPPEELGPRGARTYTPEELNQAAEEVSQAGEKMKAAEAQTDKPDLKRFRAIFYVSMYRLAEAVSFANEDAAADGSRQKAQQLVVDFVADPSRLKELASYGAKWLVYGKRTTPGIALAGTVQSVEEVGKLHVVKVQLTADAPIATLVSKIHPGVEANDEVLALGSIVERPEDQLAGYEGSEPAVVWSGIMLKLPAEK